MCSERDALEQADGEAHAIAGIRMATAIAGDPADLRLEGRYLLALQPALRLMPSRNLPARLEDRAEWLKEKRPFRIMSLGVREQGRAER
jgi:hypothetical protein